ncbi:MAG: hypothetical protein IIC64_02805 [SAR324 cluster bacterium]|nr:hypothetical protein [SAR324 cluster bacterium]
MIRIGHFLGQKQDRLGRFAGKLPLRKKYFSFFLVIFLDHGMFTSVFGEAKGAKAKPSYAKI